jgi:hypothetical protein
MLMLFLFVGVGTTSVILYKRKTIIEEIEHNKKERERLIKPQNYQATRVDDFETAQLIAQA